jgi:hypothetical protein
MAESLAPARTTLLAGSFFALEAPFLLYVGYIMQHLSLCITQRCLRRFHLAQHSERLRHLVQAAREIGVHPFRKGEMERQLLAGENGNKGAEPFWNRR